ncbi:MAG: GntR family transcriptional regulator, partial [Pseudomonadota bacterium]
MTPVSPIERKPLHQDLTDRLRALIVEGTLAPGEKLNETALSAAFGVSRTPLREAIARLASEGFVTLAPHRGARVSALTLDALEEAFPVMGALEALAGRLAAKAATEAEIEAIAALQAELRAHHRAGDRAAYFRCNEAIHDAILAAARNPTLARTSRTLGLGLRRARYFANLTQARWAEAVAEHDAILEALRRRDGERLGALLQAHLAAKLASIRTALLARPA